MATRVSHTWIESMNPRAAANITIVIEIMGPNTRNIWTERMSELAREMTWPDWVRS